MLHFLLFEFHLYFNSWSSASSLLSLRSPRATPRWAVGMGLLRHALDMVSGAAWTQGLGVWLLQRPCPYSSSTPACDVFNLSMCDTSHCTHTHSLCSQGHHLCVQPWLLRIQCPAGLCPGAAPGLFAWDRHRDGFPGKQQGLLGHVGPALTRLQQEPGRAFQLSPRAPRPLVIACPRARG